jgi:hypothetical protein
MKKSTTKRLNKMCGVGNELDEILEKGREYTLEDFGEVIAWDDEGRPFIAYRDNKKQQQEQQPQEQSFEDIVRQLTKQYPNDMVLGNKIRELCLEE